MIITDNKIIFDGNSFELKDFEEKYFGDAYGYKLSWVQNWVNDTGLKKKIVYNNQTLWYFMNYFFEWGSITVKDAPHFGEILYWIDLSENIIEKMKPDEVYLKQKNKLVREVMRRTFNKNNVKIKNEEIYKPSQKSYKKDMLLLKARVMLRSLLKKKIKKAEKTKVMLLSTDWFSEENNEKDYLWGGIVKELNKKKMKNEALVYDRLWAHYSWINILKKVKRKDNTKTFIGQYYDSKVFSEINSIHNFLKNFWKNFSKDKKFQNSIEYKGVRFFDLMQNRFSFAFNALSYEIGDSIAITKKILEARKPEIVMIDHEDNFYGKGFMVNSKVYPCKIAALQYELIYPGCIASHIKEDNNDKKNILWRPLPDIKFAGGEYIRDTLVEHCNYPKEIIQTSGQPRYDDYFRLRKEIDKGKKILLKKSINLPLDKKIVVYATAQPSYDKGSLEPVIDAVKKDPGAFLVLKVHPSGNEKSFRKTFELDHPRITITRDVNLKDLLPVSDLLITIGSTVAMEAMIFDVPVLLINTRFHCAVPYEQFNSAISIKDPKDTTKMVKKIFKDKKTQKILREGRKTFLKEYLGFVDGKSSERIVGKLRKILSFVKVYKKRENILKIQGK